MSDVPVIYRLIQAQQNEVKVLQNRPLLDLVPKEHVQCVGESGQSGVDHQLVLVLVCDQVEDEVERVFVDGEATVIKDDVSCFCV